MRRIYSAISLGLLVLLSCACTNNGPPADANDLTINLRWIKGYAGERKATVETGLMWALSFLGAEFPDGAPNAFIWNDNVVTVDLDKVRLADGTRPAWEKLLTVLKQSDEYRRMGGVDIGRFLMLSLCSPRHYFALTGVAHDLRQVRQTHMFEGKQMAVVESVIARGNRLIEISGATQLPDIAFIGYEGTGSIRDGTFERKEVEVVDFMKNGQLRFALYDFGGNLKASTTPSLTGAGKPAKCLWCHEIQLMSALKNVSDVAGYHSTKEFDAIIAERMRIVGRYRSGLRSKIDFSRTQDHTYAEWLYLTFTEPSVERVAMEWNMPIERARQRLAGKPTHAQQEFALLGKMLYRRQDVDELSPYPVIKVASDPREPSAYEPDFLP